MDDIELDTFDRDGVLVYLTYENILEIEISDQEVDVSVLASDEDVYPVVAEGFFDGDEVWRFFKTYSDSIEFDMDYPEFSTALDETE